MGERQRQGKLLKTFLDVVMYLAHKPLCPEVCCKTTNILPNVTASSELISLCIRLKQSLSKSTSPLPKWYYIHHVIVYSLDASATLHDQHSPSMFSFPHNDGICHSSIQISLPFFQNNCKYIEQYMHYFPFFNQLQIHKTLPLIPCQVWGFLTVLTQSLLLRSIFLLRIQAYLWDMTYLTILSWSSPIYHIHAWACYSWENSLYQNIQLSEVRFTCSSSGLHGNWFMTLQMSVLSYLGVLSASIHLFQHYRKGIGILQFSQK